MPRPALTGQSLFYYSRIPAIIMSLYIINNFIKHSFDNEIQLVISGITRDQISGTITNKKLWQK